MDIEKEEDIHIIVKRLTKHTNKYHTIQDKKIFISISLGIALYPKHGQEVSTLLSKADMAMYYAKKNQKGSYAIFNDTMLAMQDKRAEMKSDIQSAISRLHFKVLYQPIADVKTNEMIGAEALVRWEHPEKGLICPDEFIRFAEETGQILAIGEFVLSTVCRDIKTLNTHHAHPMKIAINISPKQFYQPEFYALLKQELDAFGIQGSQLEIELTENILMENHHLARDIVSQIKQLGCQLVLDDFGTGYSSLQYLSHLSLDKLKIDKLFIDNITTSTTNMDITKSIIDLAKNLNMAVTAEGIERDDQYQLLRQLKCDYYQGYLLGKPMPFEQFLELIHEKTTIR